MNKAKRYLLGMNLAALMAVSGTGVYAAEIQSPAQTLSALIGIPVETLYEEKGESTFGELASEYGVLDEFKLEMLENKKAILDQRVEDGVLTAEEADAIYANMIENQANCDGTGINRGNRLGMGFGMGSGKGSGYGQRLGNGEGYGIKGQMGSGQRNR